MNMVIAPNPGGVPSGASWLTHCSLITSRERLLVVGREDLLEHPPGHLLVLLDRHDDRLSRVSPGR